MAGRRRGVGDRAAAAKRGIVLFFALFSQRIDGCQWRKVIEYQSMAIMSQRKAKISMANNISNGNQYGQYE